MSYRVYCAGKIAKNDWRHTLFPGLRDAVDTYGAEGPDRFPEVGPTRGEFEYCGPYFLSCDHGCYHGDSEHGIGALGAECGVEGETGVKVPLLCNQWLQRSEVLFVWLDDPTAYGTITEIGMAYATGRLIWLYRPHAAGAWLQDAWFPLKAATRALPAANAVEAFEHFEQDAPGILWVIRNLHDARRSLREWVNASPQRRMPIAYTRGHVYFLRMEGHIKIGKTVELDRRFKQLAIQLPEPATVEHVIPCDHMDAAEHFFHRLFRDRRRNGEWFKLTDAHLRWVREMREWNLRKWLPGG